jgi:hypothetical protein
VYAGIAGGAEKCAYIRDELGFDAVINYQVCVIQLSSASRYITLTTPLQTDNVMKGLREACPQGIDIYFDNVGGEILDAALARLARGVWPAANLTERPWYCGEYVACLRVEGRFALCGVCGLLQMWFAGRRGGGSYCAACAACLYD